MKKLFTRAIVLFLVYFFELKRKMNSVIFL